MMTEEQALRMARALLRLRVESERRDAWAREQLATNPPQWNDEDRTDLAAMFGMRVTGRDAEKDS